MLWNQRMDEHYEIRMGEPLTESWILVFLLGFFWFLSTEFSTSFIALFLTIEHVDGSPTATISYKFTESFSSSLYGPRDFICEFIQNISPVRLRSSEFQNFIRLRLGLKRGTSAKISKIKKYIIGAPQACSLGLRESIDNKKSENLFEKKCRQIV